MEHAAAGTVINPERFLSSGCEGAQRPFDRFAQRPSRPACGESLPKPLHYVKVLSNYIDRFELQRRQLSKYCSPRLSTRQRNFSHKRIKYMTMQFRQVITGTVALGLMAASMTAAAGSYGKSGMKSTDGSYSTMKTPAPAKVSNSDIVDIAINAGSFETLVTALKAAGLVETLKGEGPFTVFAPTDEAFAKLPEGQLEALLADKNALTAVLTYHVVPGQTMSSDLIGKRMVSAKTVQGQAVKIDARTGVKVNNATVVKADIVGSNGVIHVIDTVILPPDLVSAVKSEATVASY